MAAPPPRNDNSLTRTATTITIPLGSSLSNYINSGKSKVDDAFQFYSDDEVRIKTLKLDSQGAARALAKKIESKKVQERKTRISFELSPELIYEDIMEELFGDDGE